MGITENLRRIWLFSPSKIKGFDSFSKQPTQLIFQLNSSLWHIIVTVIADPKTVVKINNINPYLNFWVRAEEQKPSSGLMSKQSNSS